MNSCVRKVDMNDERNDYSIEVYFGSQDIGTSLFQDHFTLNPILSLTFGEKLMGYV